MSVKPLFHLGKLTGLVLLLATFATAPTAAHAVESAPADAPPDPVVAGCLARDTARDICSAAIDSGRWQGRDLAWAYNNRGLAHATAGAYLLAIDDYTQALTLDPAHLGALMNRGNAHAVLGDMLPALADHEAATALAPDRAAAWHNLAVTLEQLGRHKDALAAYRKAIKLEPRHRGAQTGLATANCKLSRIKASSEARLALVTKGLVPATEMQEILQRAGFYRGPIDGIFGRGSRAALRAWTRKGCLPPR